MLLKRLILAVLGNEVKEVSFLHNFLDVVVVDSFVLLAFKPKQNTNYNTHYLEGFNLSLRMGSKDSS